jgi:hypothetical protein
LVTVDFASHSANLFLASDETGFLTGQIIDVNGGKTAS